MGARQADFFSITIAKYPQGVYNTNRKIPLRGILKAEMDTISFINWRYMMDNKDMKDGCGCGCQCSHRTKERSEREYKDLVNRLSRIEGQVRGIRKMIDSDAYCTDILVQVSAVNEALNSFSKVLLSNHIHTCVADDIRSGRDEAVDELVDLLKKLMK